MTAGREGRATRALRQYARDPGRSVAVRVALTDGDVEWHGDVAGDVPRPAASLLKLPLALAVEAGLSAGRVEVDGTRVGDLQGRACSPTIVAALDPDRRLSTLEMLRVMLAASDQPCAEWLLGAVGIDAVIDQVGAIGCVRTSVHAVSGGRGPLSGETTAREALMLLTAAVDASRHPITSAALTRSIRNSRIPLGATAADVAVAHKTGTLPGVAHDVARLACDHGTVDIAFLTDRQDDTLVAGYEMGICTRSVLEAWGLGVRRTTGMAEA